MSATNYNEAYNVITFFRELPLGEAKLLLALIQGELDERGMKGDAVPAQTKHRGRPSGSKNKPTTEPESFTPQPAATVTA